MDPDSMMEGYLSEEEVDWLDTNWDSVQESSSRTVEGRKETESKSKDNHSLGDENAPLMTRMQLNDYKAGMQGLDKEHINQIIYEVSKGSRFFENERRKEEQVHQRIQDQEKKRRIITDSDLQKGMIEADHLLAELKQSRDLTQTIVHVDMDAFYAAVEMRDSPSLRSKPMAVGGIGMLSTSNYEARKYGVRAAMPGFIGKKLCPQLAIVPLNFAKYREASDQVRQIFTDYDPNFCPMSLDEAYLNFTQHVAKRQSLSARERSFLKRCQTPADPTCCRCDLNDFFRDSAVGELNPNTANLSSTAPVQKHIDINGNSENMTPTRNGDSPSQAGNQSSKPSTSKTSGSTTQAVGDRLYTSVTVHSADEVQGKESGKAERHASRQVTRKSQCPSCGKTVPAYELVTFGLDVESAVHEMRCRIEQRTCLTASAGIAPNMMLSKVCSDQNKPNGQFFLPARSEDVTEFVQKLPIRKISGIGRVTEQLLGALGISTCRDLFEKRSLLYHLYSPVSFSYFMRVTCGVGSTQVARASEEERKSMSTEQTFGELSHPEELMDKCWELSQQLAEDLAKEHMKGKTISLKLKTTDFQVRTRAQTVLNYTSDADAIFSVAKGILQNEILAESPKSLRLRLMGVRISKLVSELECPQEKQNTILGFFKKASVAGGDESPLDLQKQSSSTSSSEYDQQTCTADSADRLGGLNSTEVLERNANASERVPEHVDGADGCVSEEEMDACDVSEASDCPQFIRERNISQRSRTVLQCTDRQLESTVTAAKLKTGLGEDRSRGNSRDMIENTAENDFIQNHEERGCSSEPSQAQSKNLSSSVIQNDVSETSTGITRPTSSDTSSFSHSHTAAGQTASTSSDRVDWNDEIRNSSWDGFDQDGAIGSSVTVREPFTCPVCCKPVGCINLTDFNAHIDKCLQPQSVHSPNPITKASSSKAGSNQSASQKSKNTVKSSSGNKPSAENKKQRHPSGSSSKSAKGSSSSVESGACLPRHPSTMTDHDSHPSCSSAGLAKAAIPVTAPYQSQPERSACAEPDALDYMVCPLCGAERADWTLDGFNQHVDVCLNRNTISQILREQQTSEEPSRKRPATGQQEGHKHSQQGKKAKKSQSPKTERSILSFFKR